MKLNSEDKGVLGHMIDNIKPFTEFEVRYGLPIRKFGGDRNRISRVKFIELLKYFRDNYDLESSNSTLDITFKNTNNFKSNNIRVSIEGAEAILEYCKTDAFNPSSVEILYKNNLFWSPKELDSMINDERIWTEYEEGGRRKRDRADYDSDTGVRYSVKHEIPIVYSGKGKYIIDPKINRVLDRRLKMNVYRDLDVFSTFTRDTLKNYRYKKRFSFLSSDRMFRYDFTIVKSSRKDSRNRMEWTRTFTSSRVLEGLEEYEVEMEYIGKAKDKDINKDEFMKSFITNINEMTSLIQKTSRPLTIIERTSIVNDYKRLVINNWVDRIRDKIEHLKKGKDGEFDKEIGILTRKLKNYIYKTKDGQEEISDRVRLENTFIGPKPFTLEIENFGKSDVNPMTIEEGYSVTDKADGMRMLLFIDNMGDVCFIDNRFNIRSKDFGRWRASKDLRNTIIDGEWVEKRKDGSELDQFYAFDIYFKGGKSVEDLPLSGTKGRYKVLKDTFKKLNSELEDSKIDGSEHFSVKKFHFTTAKSDIFTLSKRCYNAKREYNIDGLIFTPMHLPVGVDAQSVSGFKLDKKSKRYTFNSTSGSWRRALKWKPLDEQSIDFFVEYDTLDGKPKIFNRIIEIDGVTHSLSFKRLKLSVGSNKSDKELIQKMNPCMEVAGAVVSSKVGNYTVPMRFKPHFNYYNGLENANIPITKDGKFITVEGIKSGNILGSISDTTGINIRNRSVVELVYDGKAPEGFRWKVLRVREDKTEEYDRLVSKRGVVYRSYMENHEVINTIIKFEEGHNYTLAERNMINKLWRDCGVLLRSFGVRMRGNIYERVLSLRDAMSFEGKSIISSEGDIPIHFSYGNYYTTAYNVWNAINNPVTKDMLFGGEEIPLLSDDRYYRATGDKEDDPTAQMRKFHNRYVKSTLVNIAVDSLKSGVSELKLLDLCCGKGGDLYKWSSSGIKRVLGIDVSRDNIYNRTDGACVRYMNMVRNMESRKRMDIDFLVGDCGESISSLEAFHDERSREYYRNTFLDIDGKPMKFNIVSTQFAIHYFFNSKRRIDAFLKNVNEHLQPGGFFIGTVLDGSTVYKALCSGKERTIYNVDRYGNLVWSITRNFDCARDFYDRTKHPLNFEIEIKLPSITGEGTSYKEWLVNFDYLIKRAGDYNLVLYKDGPIPGSDRFEGLYEKNLRGGEKYIKMSEEECNLSFMYRFFMFTKEV